MKACKTFFLMVSKIITDVFLYLSQSSRNLSVLSDMTSKIWADFAMYRLVFCIRKLIRTNIFSTRINKPWTLLHVAGSLDFQSTQT